MSNWHHSTCCPLKQQLPKNSLTGPANIKKKEKKKEEKKRKEKKGSKKLTNRTNRPTKYKKTAPAIMEQCNPFLF